MQIANHNRGTVRQLNDDPPNLAAPSVMVDDYSADLLRVLQRLNANETDGLDPVVAESRLAAEGQNAVASRGGINPFRLLADQCKSSVVILLIIAATISYFLQEYLQTVGIVAAIFINAAIGFLTEYEARVSLEHLARLTGSTARTRRGGKELDLPVTDLVRGDIVLLESGDRIPADLRIVHQSSLSVDESILTGESNTVAKANPHLTKQAEEGLLFQGTNIANGKAVGLVIKTGRHTRLGNLSTTLSSIDAADTPLEQSLSLLGKQLTCLTVACCVMIAIVGLLQRREMLHMLETSIALAVAAIPEGLPVVATLALAIGLKRMVDQKALIRQLSAVETLGCTTIICTDKTGTLTENRMLVTQLVVPGAALSLSGRGYEPVGELTFVDSSAPANQELVSHLARAAALCNDARLENHGDTENWHIHGDPTEGALLTAASKLDLDLLSLKSQYARIGELPFDLERKRMSTLHETAGNTAIMFCKGAPELVLPLCNTVHQSYNLRAELNKEHLDWFNTQNKLMADRGLRVLAVAEKQITDVPVCMEADLLENDMTLLGLVGMVDPIKNGVHEAIAACKAAGIKVIMLTGDQLLTAFSVGQQLGICQHEDQILCGQDVGALSPEQLKQKLKQVTIIARLSPELKLSVVRALQDDGEIVAMTGDGVNDAPALKQANIGIATGRACSDLAKDAASLVITDDNFSTITMAIEQGRAIYQKIKVAIAYMLTASLASLATTAMGVMSHDGLLLLPLQLLWLNLIMHVFPGLGIVLDRSVAGEMEHAPRPQTERLLDNSTMSQIVLRALLIAAASLLAVQVLDSTTATQSKASSVALATLSLSLILQSWSWLAKLRSRKHPISSDLKSIRTRILNSIPMLVCTLIDLILLFAAMFFGPLQLILQTQGLTAADWLTITIISAMTFALSGLIDGAIQGFITRREYFKQPIGESSTI